MGYRVSGSGMATRVLRAFPRLVSSVPFPVLGSKGSEIRDRSVAIREFLRELLMLRENP